MVGDDGRIGHAEIVIGTSRIMLADEYPEADVLAPTTRGGTSTNFTLAVTDAAMLDSMFGRALELGATELRPVEDQFYGHRQGTLRDPFGHQWSISSPIDDFDDDRYDANSRDAGFEVVRSESTPAPTSGAAPGTDADDHQVKAHVPRRPVLLHAPGPRSRTGAARSTRPCSAGSSQPPTTATPPTSPPRPAGSVRPTNPAEPSCGSSSTTSTPPWPPSATAGGTADEPVHYESGWSADCTDDQGVRFSLSVPTYTR